LTEAASNARRPVLCYTDVGGTFTDSFVVDDRGDFVVGKAPSTPADISQGFFASLDNARDQLGIDLGAFYSSLKVIGYGATTVLNAVLTRRGGSPGMLITKGFEDLLLMERGKQSWIQLGRADRIHPVTHRHQQPLVPRSRIRGISQRHDSLGRELIPLYEHDVRTAVRELLDAGIDSLVIVYLWSFLDDSHERRTREIALEEMTALGRTVPVFLSSDISPTIRELPRANAATVEAFAGPSTLRALRDIEDRLHDLGFQGDLQVMQSAGGLAPARHVRAIDTAKSGPVGGLIGTRFIGDLYGFRNLISTDVGGTSFDVGLISDGFIGVNREPTLGGLLLSIPMMEVHSIGAGGGTISRIDTLTGRLAVGPESAGAVPGPVCYGNGGTEPTVTDADLALGYLDPDNFLGGRLKVDVEAARQAILHRVAEPLGLTLEDAAEGIRRIVDARMREAVIGLVALRGYALDDYVLLGFGGAGATHVAGYTEGLKVKAVLVFPYSAAFSAFGAAASDYEHHYHRAINIVIPPGADEDDLAERGRRVSDAWTRLEEQARDQMTTEGFAPEEVTLEHLAMVRYGRQLNDLIVRSPVDRITDAGGLRTLLDTFEDQYSRVYAKGARSPRSGYEIYEVGLIARAPKIKPRLERHPLEGTDPSAAHTMTRPAYFEGRWMDTPRYAWPSLRPGNVVAGPAVVDDPTTTLVIPPGRSLRVDEYLTVWLEETPR
jgi:N-methylhydantoinase A